MTLNIKKKIKKKKKKKKNIYIYIYILNDFKYNKKNVNTSFNHINDGLLWSKELYKKNHTDKKRMDSPVLKEEWLGLDSKLLLH